MITIERTVDISKPVQTETLRGNEFTGEQLAHTFKIHVTRDGVAVPLTGTVTARFFQANGASLLLAETCGLEDGAATVTLVKACYDIPGRFALAIYHTENGEVTCIYSAVGAVVNVIGDPEYDPGNVIGDISTLIDTANQAAEDAQEALDQATAVVSYAEQTGKTDAEKAQARTNIGAASEAVETAMAEHFPATGKLVAGISTTASANGAVATGVGTTASGQASHAEGQLTTADGQVAHAEGYGTTASGNYSHAEGFGTKASGDHQHAFGKYNVEDTNDTYLELAGNGTGDNARSNARTLDWNGNETLAGDLTVNKGGASEITVGQELSSLKSALSPAANAAFFELGLTRTYTIDTVNTRKCAFVDFPLEVGKAYMFRNASTTEAHMQIASTDINADAASQDTEVLVQGINPGRTATATPTQSAKYLRLYCNATPAVLEITQVETVAGTMQTEIDANTDAIGRELSESGDLDLTHIDGMTMSTTGTIYASSGNAVAYAKIYKGTQVTFYADNDGVFEPASCRYGFFDTLPAGGKTADSYGSGYTATAQEDCYIAFTRPGKSLFQATYINTKSVIYNTNRLVQDVYSDAGTLEMERVANTAINTSNGYWFSATGWTAGTAAVRGGASLVFLADGVSTNCRWTLCRGSLAYGNIHSFGVGYGVFVPNDADYTIIISAPADVTAFTLQYTAEGIKDKVNGYWYGKKIVWFGTSIPAGVINAGASGGIGSYPERIGNMLGARVYNEAVGSSRARAGSHALATADDPLGFAGMSPLGILLSLSVSSAEKQEFIDDWDSKWKDIVSDPAGTMSSLTPALITLYKNASWDIKLAKYLTGGAVGPCDLYVFDHGFNDAVSPGQFDDMSDVPENPTDRSYWLGAMAFLFKKILDDNPKAKILIIGHYMHAPTQGTSGAYLIKNGVDKCCAAQEKLAGLWGIPIIKTWEHMRISNNLVTKDGDEIPVLFARFPDGIHPASDTTGDALQYYAEVLAPLVATVR